MTEDDFKALASQLRQPHGEFGSEVARKMNEGNQFIYRNCIQTLQLKEDDHVLEIGMGNGIFAPEMLERGEKIKYTGVDFSQLMVEEANKMNLSWVNSGRVSFHLGDASQLPFEDSQFDKIVTINTLYFWENPTAVLNECRRVLSPAGCLTIAIRPKEEMQHFPMTKYGFQMYSPQDLITLLRDHDWTVRMLLEIAEPQQEFFDMKLNITSVICCATPN